MDETFFAFIPRRRKICHGRHQTYIFSDARWWVVNRFSLKLSQFRFSGQRRCMRRRRAFVRGGYPHAKAYVKPQHWLVKPPALAHEQTVHSNPGNIVCLFECTNTIKGDAQTAGTLGAASSPLCMRSGRIHVEPSFVSSFVFFLAIVRLTDGATIFPRQSRTPAKPAR